MTDVEKKSPSRCNHEHARAAYGFIRFPGDTKPRNLSIGRVCPECRTFWPKEDLLPILIPTAAK